MSAPVQTSVHALKSKLREQIIEHAFIAESLRTLWRHGIHDVEVLWSEFDSGGYDLVLDRGGTTRHIQLKGLVKNGARREIDVNVSLAAKVSGCVVVVVVDDDLAFQNFLWLGGEPGQPLPPIADLKVGKHSKANADGVKTTRLSKRNVPVSRFTPLPTLDAVLLRLFGADLFSQPGAG